MLRLQQYNNGLYAQQSPLLLYPRKYIITFSSIDIILLTLFFLFFFSYHYYLKLCKNNRIIYYYYYVICSFVGYTFCPTDIWKIVFRYYCSTCTYIRVCVCVRSYTANTIRSIISNFNINYCITF